MVHLHYIFDNPDRVLNVFMVDIGVIDCMRVKAAHPISGPNGPMLECCEFTWPGIDALCPFKVHGPAAVVKSILRINL